MTTPDQLDAMQRAPWAFASTDLAAVIGELRDQPKRRAMGTKDNQRRPCVTTDTEWQGHPLTVTVGLYPDGTPGEVFAQPIRAGARHGQMTDIIADACVGVSISLQHGIPPEALAKSLGQVPVLHWDEATEAMVERPEPASPVGAILAVVQDAARQADELGAGE